MKSDKEVQETNQDVWDNRERFVDFVHDNELIVKNTMYTRRNNNRCTYKNKNTGHKGGKSWNTTNYRQVDHILIETRWKNAIYEVWSTPHTCITSDHFPVIARLRGQVRQERKKKPTGEKTNQDRSLEDHARRPRKKSML